MAPAAFAASEHIRYREIDGCGVILDVRRQTYSVLDDAGTAIWACLTGARDRAALTEEWGDTFDASPSEIRDRIDRFGVDCVRKGLLRSGVDAPAAAPPERTFLPLRYLPARLAAFVALATTIISLRVRGFGRTYGDRQELPAGRVAGASLQQAVSAFLAAENLFLFGRAPDDCLARSLALFHFLRTRGFPVVHRIGVRRVPFLAHAWVEIAGEGVLAPAPRGFAPLATLVATPR